MKTVTYWLIDGANRTDNGVDRITAWAAANGLCADAIPEGAAIVVGDKTIKTVVCQEIKSSDGGRRWVYDGEKRPVTREITVPLVEMPPKDLFRACGLCVAGQPHDHF